MTPSEVETAARRKYNAVSDTFFSQAEILDLMFFACHQMARECLLIESSTTTATVIGTQTYAFPSNVISIKRITYDGMKLEPINFRLDDQLTALDSSTTSTGSPRYYWVWNKTLYLRPTPDAVETLTIYTYKEPSAITIASTLEIPSMFHPMLVDYIVSEMAAKDSNFNTSTYYRGLWEKQVQEAKKWQKRYKQRDGFSSVMDEESMPGNILGSV